MKKNITINLFGTLYAIDEDAYQLLERYLDNMKSYFEGKDGGDEIADDIEHRVAEHLWEMKNGGVEAMDKLAQQRAEILYNEIDRNKMFRGTTAVEDRSLMNICFVMNEEYAELEKPFMEFATSRGMVGIKGHRLVGGFRASCYNAMDIEGVQALVDCIKEYEAMH